LEDLYDALQDKEQRIMSNATAHTTLIPQLVWAITDKSREFYSQICKRNDVDPPDDGTPPKFAIADISIYTSMFRAGLPIEVDNMPEQWKRKKPASESGISSNRRAADTIKETPTDAEATTHSGPQRRRRN
jgi:hypothetical protein